METIKATNQLLISVRTDKNKEIPKGKVEVITVKYQIYLMDETDFNETTFEIHDASCKEAKLIAEAVNL